MENFTGNSNASKENRESKAPVTSNVTVKKDNDAKKAGRSFFAQDAKTAFSHVLFDVIVPGLQRLFSDTVKQGIDWIIYGSSGRSQSSGVGNVSYTRYYDRQYQRSLPSIPESAYNKPGAYSVNEVTFDERGKAEETLARLKEEVDHYGMVSVADFYDMISQRHSWTDCKYGWRDLSMAEVIRTYGGYSIQFPKVIVLE